jgi:hypothetical protein
MAVGTSNYPTSLDTVVELIQAANNAQTTLNGDLTASATTVAVISTALFANTGCFAVDNELISYTSKTATTFTGCVRGFDGTTAATHSSGATVSDVVTTAHHEVLVSTILALQQKLGTGNSNPTAGTVLKGNGAGSSAYGTLTTAEIDLTNAITNAMVNSSAAIAYSKLNLSGSIVNADINASAAIAYSKLNLANSIVDADVSASAGIAYSKLASLTTNRLLVSNSSGKVSASSLTWDSVDSIVGAVSGIDFNGLTTLPVANRLLWNSDFGTLMLGLTSAVSLPVGQQQVAAVKSSTNGGLVKGKVVYVVGATGGNKTVAYARSDSGTTVKTTLGVVGETVSGGAKAFTVTNGVITNLNTSTLTEGDPVFVSSSSAGDLTSTAPTAPNHRVRVGYCVRQHSTNGVLYVNVQTGYDVGELCDVAIAGTPAAGSLLVRNATAGTWVNATLTAGTGVTVTNGDGSITIAATGAAAGSTGDYQINGGSGFAAGVLAQSSGRLTATPTAVTSGVAPYLRVITPADTGLTASTEAPGIVFGGDGSGSTVTRTRAAGAVTTQREYVFIAPTYAAASATTITTAATLAITGAPVAGSNVTLTNTYASLFRTDSSSTTLANNVAVQNINASGSSGIAFLNSSGTQQSSIQYVPAGPDYLNITPPGANNSGFYIGGPTSGIFSIVNSSDWRMAFGGLVESGIRVRFRDGGSASDTTVSVDHASGSPTVNVFQIRQSAGTTGGTVRYGYFYDATESRGRIFDPNGGQQTRGTLTENVTLSTVGATTDTTIQIPANSLVLGVTVRVTTGITGIDSTSLQIGDATTAARFGSIAAFTAGTTGVGLAHLQGGISTDAAGPIVTSATAVRLTLSGGTDDTPSAGAVRVTIHYLSLTAPTS